MSFNGQHPYAPGSNEAPLVADQPDPFAAPTVTADDRRAPLPHNLDAEASVLGGVLLRNELLERLDDLEAEDFYDPRHHAVYLALREIAEAGRPMDVVTLGDQLQQMGKLEAVGGLPFLLQLELRVPTADNAIHYAGIVRDLAAKRRLLYGLSDLLARAPSMATEDVAEEASRVGRAAVAAEPVLRLAVDVLPELAAEAALPMIETGFGLIDDLLGGGFAARTMTELIGPTGSGKTALAAQIAARHAERAPVLFYSGELTLAQLVARVIAQRTGTSWRRVLSLEVDEATMRSVLTGLSFYVLRRCDSPIRTIRAAASTLARRGDGVPLVVIDYAQLVADVGENMRLAVMQSVRGLHRLTESMDVAMLLLAQGSRASSRSMREAGGTAEDYVDAGAETAQLEQAAANVITLLGSRPEGASEWDVTAAVAKARYGRPGKVGLHFCGASGRWSELDAVPATDSEQARDLEIETIVRAHPGNCDRCNGKPLSINALTDKDRHKVAGNKTQVTASVRRLEGAGRIRNEGGALLPMGGRP